MCISRTVLCGAPDYIITKGDIPVGFIEAKDIGKPLDSKEYKEQFDRYRKSLENLIITDYLDFWLYIDGELKTTIRIGEISNGNISPVTNNFSQFINLIKDFCTFVGQTIKSAPKLSKMMAGKARMLAQVIENALNSDEETKENSSIRDQMQAFKNILIHDITPKDFADIYAQTIAYGMFAARLHDPTLENFSRQEAAELIPKTNPFLRKLFQYIAGYDLDDRLKWIVDSLADIFRATDVKALLKNFGRSTQQNDPIIQFYETFLSEYDPKLRKSRGVWYTPEPVVNFIVRAVDDILKTEFGLKDGLADTTKTTIELDTQTKDNRSKTGYKKVEKEVHKVQILDPACGTGTFLSEVVKQIYKRFQGQQGIWSGYVEDHLIPRLNGFEILMAPYAMAHLKLELLLSETGYKTKSDQRLRVYLTNSLEEHHPDTGTLFASWLSSEANEANHVKRDTPVMVVLGNPPYSISSSNRGIWIQNLLKDYKKDLNEKKLNLDDDYIKFIRFGQYYIEKNSEGILAFISNNSFIEGITHRQMRHNLLSTFDKIYIINLHGNSRKKEKSPDGSIDKNVFDIQQGVSINIFIKTKKSNKIGEVFHLDIYGKRELKYTTLFENDINTLKWKKIENQEPYYFFVPKDFSSEREYSNGFSYKSIFIKYSAGIKTKVDHIATSLVKKELSIRVNDILTNKLSFPQIRSKYGLSDRTTWEYKPEYDVDFDENEIIKYSYRPLDNRYIYYNHKFLSRSRKEVMIHLIKDNYALSVVRQSKIDKRNLNTLITKTLTCEDFITNHTFTAPLYLYSYDDQQTLDNKAQRTPNLNADIVKEIEEKLGLTFTNEKEETEGTIAPIDILDYIYAVLHSPYYREKFKEFLKIDFPRVPYPKNRDTFWKLVKLGDELRQIHLLESPVVNQYITSYPVDGNNEVGKIKYEDGKVWINDTQYFDKVPQTVWEFYIGGYQPAQKWLKDRKSRHLSFEDVLHYQKIIVALTETDRIMEEIDMIDFMS